MRVYKKGQSSMMASKDQMETLLEAGWSVTKPEPTEEEIQAKQDELDQEKQELLDKEDFATRVAAFNEAEEGLILRIEVQEKAEEDLAEREKACDEREKALVAKPKSVKIKKK